MNDRIVGRLLVSAVLVALVAGCTATAAAPEPTATAYPTYTRYPTYTPLPTMTPVLTATPRPTYTPFPTPTDVPPTETSTPSPVPPTPTTTPSPTVVSVAQPATAAPSMGTSSAAVLAAIENARVQMEEYGGMIDVALGTGSISCEDVVTQYDAIAGLPALNVAGGSDAVVGAHDQYRQAVALFTSGARDMAQNCRDFLVSQEPGTIPFQQWGLARVRVNEAVAVLYAAARMLQ